LCFCCNETYPLIIVSIDIEARDIYIYMYIYIYIFMLVGGCGTVALIVVFFVTMREWHFWSIVSRGKIDQNMDLQLWLKRRPKPGSFILEC